MISLKDIEKPDEETISCGFLDVMVHLLMLYAVQFLVVEND